MAAGEIVALAPVRVWLTVTLTLLLTLYPKALVIETVRLYVPALENVATAFLAALVPLAEKVTVAGGVPMVDHV